MLKDFPADIEAVITFLTFEEGGRKTPVFSGYRPQFFLFRALIVLAE